MSTTEHSVRWTGTAEVVPREGNTLLGTAAGAYVAVVGLASTPQAFRTLVERAMSALEFDLIQLEDVRQIRTELDRANIDAVIRRRLETLSDENPVEVGSFHAFSE